MKFNSEISAGWKLYVANSELSSKKQFRKLKGAISKFLLKKKKIDDSIIFSNFLFFNSFVTPSCLKWLQTL